MSLSDWFGFSIPSSSEEIPDIFPLSITQSEFIKTQMITIFSKILTDTLERTHGLSDDQMQLMWDNCVKSNSTDGLVTLLSKAMSDKKELFIVYEKAVKVIRVATTDEEAKIRADYEKTGKSSVGIFISFKNYLRSDMLRLYASLEFCCVSGMYKSSNLSKAVQIKISDLRKSVSLTDAADAKSQALVIAKALGAGKDVMLDAEDEIATAVPDLTAARESVTFISQKLALYLGMPASYLTGEQTSGMGTTGEQDTKAVERGLKGYFSSIVKPTLDTIFAKDVTYKSQDFRQIKESLEVLKTFALTDDSLISAENKLMIINRVFDLPENAKGDEVEEPDPKTVVPGQPPQKGKPVK